MELDFIQKLVKAGGTKIVMLVLDGLGGLPMQPGGKTELESANTPNLDRLAREGISGLQLSVGTGITPGSGPGHLGLFGYNPVHYQVGRGVLEAVGVEFGLKPGDVAARGNFCTVDDDGLITDRRAGRISTEKNKEVCALLQDIKLDGAQVFVQTVTEHRMLFVLRGEGLDGRVEGTDPQALGVPALAAKAEDPAAEKTARLVNEFVQQAAQRLAGHHPANMLLLRGFAQKPAWPSFAEVYGLKACAIASYPMYRGVAELVGMEPLHAPSSLEGKFALAGERWDDFDFFFVHKKDTDSRGEDGDFAAKVAAIEEADRAIPALMALNPDVVIVTGDHSTPSKLMEHSWHPVPVLLWSKDCRPDEVETFGERACLRGALGARLPAIELMPLALANAHRLEKFGA